MLLIFNDLSWIFEPFEFLVTGNDVAGINVREDDLEELKGRLFRSCFQIFV